MQLLIICLYTFHIFEFSGKIDYVVGGRLDLSIHGPERDRLKSIRGINLFLMCRCFSAEEAARCTELLRAQEGVRKCIVKGLE